MNILGIAIMLIGRYGGHIGKLGFWELDARVELILSVKASKRLGATIERAVTVIIMLATK
jgi:hypothetical protein